MFFSLFQTSKNSLSELEKREKRSMERKLSEMEEELKVSLQFCKYKIEFYLFAKAWYNFRFLFSSTILGQLISFF